MWEGGLVAFREFILFGLLGVGKEAERLVAEEFSREQEDLWEDIR